MADAFPLPPRPNLEQYRKLAKDFQRACKSGVEGAIRDLMVQWSENVARLRGREITPDLRRQIDYEAQRIESQWRKHQASNEHAQRCALSSAQFFIARGHGFASWPKFSRHVEALMRANTPISKFESAADAIVSGDLKTLRKLLHETRALIRARSSREHRSTLLHYVSANGIEDFRQTTPPNIVEITRLLLDAGADVNAESDAYGGRSTTLGLTATSWHPQHAGVQLPLMDLLISRGAVIDGPDGGSAVNGCLHNGRGEAAEFFASRGAHLDFEGACGVGRIDLVKTLASSASEQELKDGFAWACEFGRTEVAEFLIQRGLETGTSLKHHGQTGLHWAALHGHLETAKLLLRHGAPVNVKDPSFDGTPLEWGLYGWSGSANPRGLYHDVVALLIKNGAEFDLKSYESVEDPERQETVKKLRSDPRMMAALNYG
jgi:ankyrin repeat protein